MQVLVTGASGHVGAALVRALLTAGHEVRALVRSDTRSLTGLPVEQVRGDVTDQASLQSACEGAQVVFHAAARISLDSRATAETEATNVGGTHNVLKAAHQAGVKRVVHFSSAHALKDGELRVAGTGQAYERSKAGAEREVLLATERGQDVVVVSPCAVIGPHDHKPSPMGKVLMMIARGLLPATVRAGQSWVDVRDVAQAAVSAATQGKPGARYVLAGHWHTLPELAKLTSVAAGVKPPVFSVSTGIARAFAPLVEHTQRLLGQEPLVSAAAMDALESVPRSLDLSAHRDLGHEPRPLAATLRDALDWYCQQGMLKQKGLW